MKRMIAIYCSNKCQQDAPHRERVAKWLAGEISGNYGVQVADFVRRHLIETRGAHCEECGWNRVNTTTKRIPLTVSHTDGNWRNTVVGNLKLLCPNCHALTPTYGGANRGSGRWQELKKKYVSVA